MRLLRCTLPSRLLLAILFVLSIGGMAKAATPCSPIATYKYPDKKCTITIDRSVPGSPLPIQVPAGTTVTILVNGQRKTEILKTATSNDAVATPDIFGNAIKQFSVPLGSVILHAAVGREPLVSIETPVFMRQSKMKDAFQSVADDLTEANQRLACLQAFTVFDSSAYVCTQAPLAPDDFDDALSDAKDSISTASTEALPYIELQQLDAFVTTYLADKKNCPVPDPDGNPDPTKDNCDIYQSNEQQLDNSIKSLAAMQAALSAFTPSLDAIDNQTETSITPISNTSNHKATVVITAQEQLGKTSAAVATVTITWLQSNWSLSTGVVLSSLANQTFTNSPQYSGGSPIIDGNGKTPTIVTVARTYPGIISPVFFVNFRLHNFQKWQGRWAFLVSGGIGLNPATKTADFATGASFQCGNVIFGPVLHYGRQTNLINGVKLGDQLGDSPPALPTNNILKPAAGISITYRLPIT